MNITFDLLTIDWTAIGSVATFAAVIVALWQSNYAARQLKRRNAHLLGMVAVLCGRATDQIDELLKRTATKESASITGLLFEQIGSFKSLLESASAISLAELPNANVVDGLLRVRVSLLNCQQLVTTMAKGSRIEVDEDFRTLREAFVKVRSELEQTHAKGLPLWKRLKWRRQPK